MQTPTKCEDSGKRPVPSPQRGAPSTHAAHAVRKNVTVRVSVKAAAENEELPEHGYGHGV